MNQKLQNILEIIQQSEKLDPEQKDNLIKAVKDADKELEITAFKLERTEKVKKTTAILLEETIEELEQKRKAVEKHNRELEIEAALERVRSRSMAMHKSNELKDVAAILFEKLYELNIVKEEAGGNASIFLYSDPLKGIDQYVATDPDLLSSPDHFHIPYSDHPITKDVVNAKESGAEYFAKTYSFEEKNAFFKWSFENSDYKRFPDHVKKFLLESKSFSRTDVFSKNSSIFIPSYTGKLLSENEIHILKRFANVFDQAYIRFLDLQKAEAQAREAQIEAALERVRSRSMGMHKSNELKDVVRLLYKEFRILVTDIHSVNIQLNLDSSKDIHFWASVEEDIYPEIYHLPYSDVPIFEKIYNAFNSHGEGFFEYSLNKKEKDAFFSGIFKIQPVPPQRKKMIQNAEGMVMMGWFHKHSGIDIVRYNLKRFSEEEKEIVKRFAAAFEQTYIRFLDLQKAESLTRESQIQLALERVRARTMAMHKSDELAETAAVLFQQMTELGVTPERITIGLIKEETKVIEVWSTDQEGIKINYQFNVSLDEPTSGKRIYEAWKEKKKSLIIDLSGQELNDWIHYVREVMGMTIKEELVREHRIHSVAFFSQGLILTTTPEPLPEESINLLERFADVFNLTYRRFLDLKKAEAQAREAQMEASLERVRSLALGMRKSIEVGKVTDGLFAEFNNLSVDVIGCSIVVIDEKQDTMELWRARSNIVVKPFESSSFDKAMNILQKYMPDWFPKFYNALGERKKYLIEEMSTKNRDQFLNAIAEQYDYSNDEKSKLLEITPKGFFAHFVFFKLGYLALMTEVELSDEELSLARRFMEVFDFAYTRFLDITKAEAQAREAEIEAALERVRSRTMAMQQSDEFSETAGVLFEQFVMLGIVPKRCVIGIIDETKDNVRLWFTSSDGKVVPGADLVPLNEQENLINLYKAWKNDEEHFSFRIEGQERVEWTSYMMEKAKMHLPEYQPESIDKQLLLKEPAVFNNFFFTHGFVMLHTVEELQGSDIPMLKRFAGVFEQTYTRFLDLKIAEAQTHEAIKQASLDRIRGEIASMRTAEDLNRITPIIWRELKTLEVPFIRCGVFIVNKTQEKVQVYLTTPDGKSLGVLNLPFASNELTSNTVEHWRKKQVYKEQWNKEQFIIWTKSMMELGQVQNAETYQGSSTPPESLNLHFVPFTQGMLYVGDVSPLKDEKLDLVKTLAEAFSIAYARYEDFKNLKEAKNKIELTLSELKSAQAQLVHSEKMASLGELTAGIAHEIKNPLNFVNNFSEISGELLDEIKVELEKNDKEEVLSILNDLKQNLEKINQHGKRADSIVKGMLLHSRGTSGEKTLTDINDLLDQYVNLAYHGMRATNKEFNITIEKDYDKTLEKINVVPQDISRVFLNIINNACYAAYDRKKKGSDNKFSPTLKVSTKNLNDKVEIRIGDNGDGIPESIKRQIFNPFFTTKPTGEGTGLGLSLSYDIVTKVHGGNIKVESEEGKGAMFIIQLPLS